MQLGHSVLASCLHQQPAPLVPVGWVLPQQHEWASEWLGTSARRACLVQDWHAGLIAVLRVGLRVGLRAEPCVTGPCLHHTLLLLPHGAGEHHPFPGSATCPGCCSVTVPLGAGSARELGSMGMARACLQRAGCTRAVPRVPNPLLQPAPTERPVQSKSFTGLAIIKSAAPFSSRAL